MQNRCFLSFLLSFWGVHGFLPSSHQSPQPFGLRYRLASADMAEDIAPLGVETSLFDDDDTSQRIHRKAKPAMDPSLIEFAPSERFQEKNLEESALVPLLSSSYPFAMMMQGSAPYIAAHAGQTAVFHIPGDLLDTQKQANSLFNDMALAWLLGMKIVVVIGCRYDMDACDLDFMDHPHECHNSLKVTDAKTLRRIAEEAGYLRTEVERKLNKYLRLHGATTATTSEEGNVVSGHFYTAQQFGQIRGEDFEYTGFVTEVHQKNIERLLRNNDLVLLTTVGVTALGELVNVNGYHLSATVAAALGAYKLIYMASEGTVLKAKGEQSPIQEVSLSFAESITDYHEVQVHNTGFATFERARQALEPGAVELLLHLGWASWALENGVKRAHIVNGGDGAILEELFTTKNGANTCLYHDNNGNEIEQDRFAEDWSNYFASAAKKSKNVSAFSK